MLVATFGEKSMFRPFSILIVCLVLVGCREGISYKPDEWVKCDGLSSPKPSGIGLANAVLYTGSLGLLGNQMPEGAKQYFREKGENGVVACTQVLESGVLDNESYWLRHINILKARAIHSLENGDGNAALADLNAIDVVAGNRADDIFYQRSLGLSLLYLKGLSYQEMNKPAKANNAFQKFSERRPYSRNIQFLALMKLSEGRINAANRVVQLDSNYLHMYVTLMEWELGQETKAADNWAYLVSGQFYRKSSFQHTNIRNINDSTLIIGQTDPTTLGRAAISAARVNRMEQANKWIKQAKYNLAGLSQKKGNRDGILQRLQRISSSSNEDKIKYQEILVKAYGQYFVGDIEGARASLTSAPTNFPLWAPLLALVEKLQQNFPLNQRQGILELDVKSKWEELSSQGVSIKKDDDFLNSLFTRLPSLERKSTINSYSSKAWFFKQNGFSEKALDDGTHQIEFLGSSSTITVVDEMTLLRAAELAMKASKPGFVIVGLNNYERKIYSTYNGMRVSPDRHAGYITKIKVAFIDPLNIPKKWKVHKGRIFDAEKVWHDLAPIYLNIKKNL